jgi:hypothetical protein
MRMYERHVKVAAGSQQQHPAEAVGQQEICSCNDREKEKECGRVEKHAEDPARQ